MKYLGSNLAALGKAIANRSRMESTDALVNVPPTVLPIVELPSVMRENPSAATIVVRDSTYRQINYAGVVGTPQAFTMTVTPGLWRITWEILYQGLNAAIRPALQTSIIISDTMGVAVLAGVTGQHATSIALTLKHDNIWLLDRNVDFSISTPSLAVGDACTVTGVVIFNRLF